MLANFIACIANSDARLEIILAAACIASHIVANIAAAAESALVAEILVITLEGKLTL